jgi:hypothetical protein
LTQNNEATNDTGLRRHFWPPSPETDWTSVREQVRMSGTVWNDDASPSTELLRHEFTPEAPVPRSFPEKVLYHADRALTWWIQLPDRIRNRYYAGIAAAGVAIFLVLLRTI